MNYTIENNLDLYTLIQEDFNNELIQDNNICLLTKLPLEENYIMLSCKHTFNYMSLYEEIRNQKIYNHFDTQSLNYNEIKCPYCRTITKNLLPYFCIYNIDKIYGVTQPQKYALKLYECTHINKSGKNGGTQCNCSAFISNYGTYCNKHYSMLNKKFKKNNNNDTNNAQPSIEQPSIEQPSIEQPSIEQPSIEQPSIEQPSIEQPSIANNEYYKKFTILQLKNILKNNKCYVYGNKQVLIDRICLMKFKYSGTWTEPIL